MLFKCLAPAMLQSEVSFLILATTTPTGTALLRKIRAFLSFHNSQEISSIKEASGLCDWVFLLALWLHHSLTEVASLQSEGCTSWRPSQSLIIRQTLKVYRHWNRRWAADSWTCLHSGQRLQFGHPRRWSLSAVQILLFIANQAKNLHLGGAQIFQTIDTISVSVWPKNCAL